MRVISDETIPIKMWLDDLEEGAEKQARNLANLPFAFHHIAIMPDAHQGYGMPIGGVLATQNVVIPNCVGVDIGCGMTSIKTDLTSITEDDLKRIVKEIQRSIPVGFNHHNYNQPWEGFDRAPNIDIINEELNSARKQLGTLGGGNHFIEIQKGNDRELCSQDTDKQSLSDGFVYVMIHSGSRNFGYKIANHYHALAKKNCERWFSNVPPDLSFLPLDDELGQEYITAMGYALEFAKKSRARMMLQVRFIIEDYTGCNCYKPIDIHHNYAALENHFGTNVMVHRKGAIRVRKGELGIIPGSQGTSSYIVEGLGNPDSFDSSSHGAGRAMSRTKAKTILDLENEQENMKGIIHNMNSRSKLDEAPSAYKSIDVVMENQKDLVTPIVELKPLAVLKG